MVTGRRIQILLADRDAAEARAVRAKLQTGDVSVEWADTAEKAFNRLDSGSFDALITELMPPRLDGMRLVRVARERNPDVCAVLIADPPNAEMAMQAMQEGAYDYVVRPVHHEKLAAVIQRGLDHQGLLMAQHALRRRLDERFGLGNLTGQSRQMMQVYNTVRQAALVSTPVLIWGEPGAGKDLIAQALHNSSTRRDEAFVKFDCASLPARLQEIELLGHAEIGASGSEGRWRGYAELADKGTLFLDEVWALPPLIQDQILQIIRHGRYERPGDGQRIRADVRIIASSTRSLEALTSTGAFSESLYAALCVITLHAPALRERLEDIPLLVEHLAQTASREANLPFRGISRNGLDLMQRYRWPGNVRELKNVVEGMVTSVRGTRTLDVEDIPAHIRSEAAAGVGEIRLPAGTPMCEIERIAIEQTLKHCGYNREACAQTLGIGLRTLYRKLKEYDIH